jgi:hypothetical protein
MKSQRKKLIAKRMLLIHKLLKHRKIISNHKQAIHAFVYEHRSVLMLALLPVFFWGLMHVKKKHVLPVVLNLLEKEFMGLLLPKH